MIKKIKIISILATISVLLGLIFGCNTEEQVIKEHTHNKEIKLTVIPLSELLLQKEFNSIYSKIPKKKVTKLDIHGRSAIEEQYGFTILDAPITVIVKDDQTFYNILVKSDNNVDNKLENLVLTSIPNQLYQFNLIRYNAQITTLNTNLIIEQGVKEVIDLEAQNSNETYRCTITEYMTYACSAAGTSKDCQGNDNTPVCHSTTYMSMNCTGGSGSGYTNGDSGGSSSSGSGSSLGSNGIYTSPVTGTYININLTTTLSLNPAQDTWINSPSQFRLKKELQIYLFNNNNLFNIDNTDFAKDFIVNAISNPNLNIDFNLSTKSPAFIDMSSVNGNTPEEIKFREVYQSLTTSSDFKNLFINLFGVSPLFNVKFNITNIPTTSQGQPSGQCTLYGNSNNTNLYNIIEIDRNALLTKSKLEIALVVLHECIHAFLNIKLRNPNIGMSISTINDLDFQECVNTYYNGFSGNQTQHSFFVQNMIPTIVNVLGDIKEQVLTSAEINVVENPISNAYIYATTPSVPSTKIYSQVIPWNWTNFFTHFSYIGLQNCPAYPLVYPTGSQNELNFNQYIYISIFTFLP